jgi:tetratricopeptide (TPR) repeat protein
MSYRIKVPTKTIQVDEAHLMSGLEHALFRLREYRGPLLVALGVLLLAGAVVGGVFWVDHQAALKAQELEREASRILSMRSTADPQKAEALLKQAITLYRQAVDGYPRSLVAPLALFHLGNALVQSNDLPAAIEAYQRFLILYGSQQSLVPLVQQRLAYVYLLKGDRDQAVKAFTAVVDTPGALNKDQALFELGRLEESQSRPEGALAHYQELIKSYPSSPYASEATVRTKMLDPKNSAQSSPTAPGTAPPAASAAPSKAEGTSKP